MSIHRLTRALMMTLATVIIGLIFTAQPATAATPPSDPVGTVREIPMWNLSGQGVMLQPVERWGKPTDDPVWLVYFVKSETAFTTESVCPTTAGDIATWTGTATGDWRPIQEGHRTAWAFHADTPKVLTIYFGRFQFDATHEVHLTGKGLNGYSVVATDGTFRCLKANNPDPVAKPLPPIGSPPSNGGGSSGGGTTTPGLTVDEVRSWCSGCEGEFKLLTNETPTAVVYTFHNPQGNCPAGFDVPPGHYVQGAWWDGESDGPYDEEVAANNRLFLNVCAMTFRKS